MKGHSTVGGGILRGLGTKTLLCDVMPYDACCQFPGVEVRQEVKQISVVEAFHVISCSANVIKSIKKNANQQQWNTVQGADKMFHPGFVSLSSEKHCRMTTNARK